MAYTAQHERPCQSQSLSIPSISHADPNALEKGSLLPEHPCAKRHKPASHSPLHTPPTRSALKRRNLQVGNLIPEFHSAFSVATVLHSLT